MNEMKYIVVESDEQGQQIFIFPKNVDHDKMAEVLSYIRVEKGRGWNRVFRKPVSAGFTDGKTCYGESVSLDLRSNGKRDAQILLNGRAEG